MCDEGSSAYRHIAGEHASEENVSSHPPNKDQGEVRRTSHCEAGWLGRVRNQVVEPADDLDTARAPVTATSVASAQRDRHAELVRCAGPGLEVWKFESLRGGARMVRFSSHVNQPREPAA